MISRKGLYRFRGKQNPAHRVLQSSLRRSLISSLLPPVLAHAQYLDHSNEDVNKVQLQ
jgi:hypothetical protein